MKKILLVFMTVLVYLQLNAQVTYTVSKGTGNSFSPSTLIVNQGDIVHFALSAPHDVTQVSQATWNANGTTPLAGGFVFASGSGDFTATTPGTIYFVCTVHVASDQMKGTITVNAVTGINDTHKDATPRVYPNPARDYVTFITDKNSTVEEIKILDLSGKAVKILPKSDISGEQVKMDIANLNRGMYFIVVRNADGIVTEKFLKP
jgi:plastocyanin